MSPQELISLLEGHATVGPREERSRRQALGLLRWLRRPYDEFDDPAHVTGSAIIIDGAGHVVLHLHRRLGLWLQPGGHIDPDEAPGEAALREAIEETGLPVRHPDGGPRFLHVDVHQGPRGHTHLDMRYLLIAPPGSVPAPPEGESQDVEWVTYAEAARRSDPSVADALAAVAAREVSGG